MRTRTTDKEPDPEDAPRKSIRKLPRGRFYHGNKAMCKRLKAINSFYKVKEWVE